MVRVLARSAEGIDQTLLSVDDKSSALLLLEVFGGRNKGLSLNLSTLEDLPMRSAVRIMRLPRHTVGCHVTRVLIAHLMDRIELFYRATGHLGSL